MTGFHKKESRYDPRSTMSHRGKAAKYWQSIAKCYNYTLGGGKVL